nr:28S ribosomal protein S18b, mitochondrial isoform X3 [Caretta caretta]XP_048674675.1 28S ribosomal protein S18b, mitochondrial isoform X3 [Caretta caretta]XP_048674676.1 28S ribosomal protein S18b, mitochondrial isoform X3 [Caretta caretta]XP_048674677.1 28S ribosomal protein S18b, mitochondrial isoform X3 [Caretta caretta]
MDPTTSAEPVTFDTESRFKEKPWEYLETEGIQPGAAEGLVLGFGPAASQAGSTKEYIERYGDKPIWFGYRRNHKGPIPPQKTRKTCIRGKKIVGNPCPICRDQKLHVDYRNVKLLEQFICSHTGITFHPTRTGVCMKQHKRLTQAIDQARDHGLLSFRIPLVTLQGEDYTNQHQAVAKTPPALSLQSQTPWYPWYEWQQPPEKDIARIRRIYKDYLKEETGLA